ncbi:MAG: hypothetical protein JST_000326 [Candidatus Parcubacteria bacterium]|jgi:WD40 repeat protein|nr:MAG: hypothetical protein JST_2980 [Candidatus Parcubacteria bacterium]
MKKAFKYGLPLLGLGLALGLILASSAKTNYVAYYSGDAIAYKNQIIIATTDSGALEIFRQDGKNIERTARLKADAGAWGNDFSSVKLDSEDNRLLAYATAGFSLYQYDLSNLEQPKLLQKKTNTYFEWYQKVDKFGNHLVTASDKGVKVWRSDGELFDVVDSYPVTVSNGLSLRFDAAGRYIVSMGEDNLVRVYDATERKEITRFPVNYRQSSDQKRLQFDSLNNEILIFDDFFLKRFSLDGDLLTYHPNSAYNGYSVEATGDPNYVYAANGENVMRLSKKNFRDGLKINATNLNRNGWAMGLKYINVSGQESLVVFNGGGITVLNSSLEKIASINATEIAENPKAKEPLSLNAEAYVATPGAQFNLRGTGFFPNEELVIKFAADTKTIKADGNGRFQTNLTVPSLSARRTDIKVTGSTSNLTYSTSFEIK